jgi:hypothetical protein
VARRHAEAHGLGDDDVIISRERLHELQDGLYLLEAALDDVSRDLAGASPTKADLREALDWIVEHAEPLVATRFEPSRLESAANTHN